MFGKHNRNTTRTLIIHRFERVDPSYKICILEVPSVQSEKRNSQINPFDSLKITLRKHDDFNVANRNMVIWYHKLISTQTVENKSISRHSRVQLHSSSEDNTAVVEMACFLNFEVIDSFLWKYRFIHKPVKHFKNSQPINYSTDHGSSYVDRERNSPSF